MEESLDQVAERLTKLEVTVAQGFHDSEERDIALSQKIDVNTESLRSDLQTVIETVNSLAEEMRRTTDSIRKEHAADRKVFTVVLGQHARRLHDLEQRDK